MARASARDMAVARVARLRARVRVMAIAIA